MKRYRTMEEVKREEAFAFYRELGYSEEEAVTCTMIDVDMSGGGYPRIVEAYGKRPAEDTSSFPEFFCRYVFDPGKLKADGFDTGPDEPEEIVEEAAMGFGRPMVFESAAAPAPAPRRGLSNLFSKAAPSAVMGGRRASNENAGMAAPVRRGAAVRREEAVREPAAPVISPEDIRTDSYEDIEEKGMRSVVSSPTCTFRTTYNTAAATVLLSNIRQGWNTRLSMVRTEELLNYLSYDLAQPEEAMFAVTPELKRDGNKAALFLGIQGKRTLPKRQNICFLLDVSGSMSSRSANMMMAIMAVLSKMNDGDIFSLVTYSSRDKVVINGLKLKKETDIGRIIYTIAKEVYITGATNGSAGLNRSYEIIGENRVDGVNRVIIMTDGDLNFGIHDKDGLKGLISKKRATGAYFSAIGTGIFNLMDDKLETLAKNGNGNYFVVNAVSDIRKCLVDRYESLVFPIAKNVKAQVEFNPAVVSRYKLVGYENRMLNHEDFRDDTVIAEPFGSGSYCVALFELEMADGQAGDTGLKYQTVQATGSTEIGTITLRYEDAEGSGFHEESFAVPSDIPHGTNVDIALAMSVLASRLRGNNPDSLTKENLKEMLERPMAAAPKAVPGLDELEKALEEEEEEKPSDPDMINGGPIPGFVMNNPGTMSRIPPAPPAPPAPSVPARPLPSAPWDCPACGQKGNEGFFCTNCGTPMPEPAPKTWDCPACGKTGNSGNFCPLCGSPKPAAPAGWTCGFCGYAGNTGRFCAECGAKKPE